MKSFLSFIIALVALATPYIFIYLAKNWRRLIWENKGRAFRVVKKGDCYYPEKRFLRWFFVRIKINDHYKASSSRKYAMEYIQKFLQNLDEEQNYKNEVIDFSNQITDQNRLIESKTLETKRIDYDSN